MKLFITGASGFVGGAVAAALRADYDIVAMSRSVRSDARIRAAGVTPLRCSLADVDAAHLAGCEVVVHSAAFVGAWGTRQQFREANVAGTTRLLEAARAAGVRRFVHIGTEAALFRGQPMRDIDETYPYPARTPYLYAETKAEAERRVLAANAPGFETLSLRPRMVWGPGDQTILPAVVRMVEAGRFVWVDGGRARTSTTHIDNLVHAVRLALTSGRGGEAYFVTDGPPTTIRVFLTALLATAGVTPPDRSMPGWLLRGLAFCVEGGWRLFGLRKEPPLTRFAVALMACEGTLRIDKARREMGYAPVLTREEGLEHLAAQATKG